MTKDEKREAHDLLTKCHDIKRIAESPGMNEDGKWIEFDGGGLEIEMKNGLILKFENLNVVKYFLSLKWVKKIGNR